MNKEKFLEELNNLLESNHNDNTNEADSYNRHQYIMEGDEEIELKELEERVVDLANSCEDVLKVEYEFAGGFESCGYSVTGIVVAILYKDLELELVRLNFESF